MEREREEGEITGKEEIETDRQSKTSLNNFGYVPECCILSTKKSMLKLQAKFKVYPPRQYNLQKLHCVYYTKLQYTIIHEENYM